MSAAACSPFYSGIMSDNNYNDLLALHPDEAMDTIGSDQDSIFQEDDTPEEEIDHLQGILQSNSDILT